MNVADMAMLNSGSFYARLSGAIGAPFLSRRKRWDLGLLRVN